MYILINEQQIGIAEEPKVTRNKYDGTDTFKVIIPRENLTATEIDELCIYIKENAPVIELFDANGEKVQIYDGFNLYPVFAPDRTGTVWNLTIENESELKYQYGLLKNRAEKLEKLNTAQATLIKDQAAAIENLNQQLLVVQLAAAELYEQNLKAEPTEETEEPAEETTEEEVEESDAATDQEEPEEATEPEMVEPETVTETEQEEQ